MQTPVIKVESFLANLPLFRELSKVEIERLAQATRPLRVARAEMLFHRGDLPRGFYLVVYGQVKLSFSTSRGDEKVVELIGPGQSFGEAVMFMERPHVVTCQALADSLVLHVTKEAVQEELERDPRFARRIIAGLSMRLHGLMADLEDNALRSATQRVIGYLLRDSGEGANGEGAIEVTLPAAKGVVASRLSLTQEHFSRILHELTSQGLVEVRGRLIHICDVARLRDYSG
ncbi:MAG: Crp/Fnr family transcriptional regulator [Betaproteobacteria bacterium]|nr:Crp/Fnr family transcriptional regulator [Betaproteobacteria bacterium]